MNLTVRFWNPEENQVNARYLNSVLLDKTTNDDLLQAIKENVSEANLKKVV